MVVYAQGAFGAPAIADRPLAQVDIARAEAELRAARAFFYESIEHAWDYVLAGDAVPVAATKRFRLRP